MKASNAAAAVCRSEGHAHLCGVFADVGHGCSKSLHTEVGDLFDRKERNAIACSAGGEVCAVLRQRKNEFRSRRQIVHQRCAVAFQCQRLAGEEILFDRPLCKLLAARSQRCNQRRLAALSATAGGAVTEGAGSDILRGDIDI